MSSHDVSADDALADFVANSKSSKRKREQTPEAQAYKHSCEICVTDYLSIARRSIVAFGVFQCIEGHHLCKPCWEKLQHKSCPTCRADMCKPMVVRVLEDDVKEHPADCKWDGCCKTELTLGTKRKHERACSQRVVSCVCGFEGIHASKIDHQRNCIKHHLKPLRQKVDKMQETIEDFTKRIATLESRLQDTTAVNAEASSPAS